MIFLTIGSPHPYYSLRLLYRDGVAWRSESLNISDMPSLFGRKLKHPVNCVAEHFHAKGKSMILLPDADVGWADRSQCHDFADEVAVVQTCPEKCGALWSSANQLMRGGLVAKHATLLLR